MSDQGKKQVLPFTAPSRRQVMIGGAAAVAAAGLGGVTWIATADPKDMILTLVERALPGVTIAEESREPFAQDVLDATERIFAGDRLRNLQSKIKQRAATAVGEAFGYEIFPANGAVGRQIDLVTRRALGLLLPNSNFFLLEDPRSEPIVYFRRDPGTACVNPFADLSPPA